MPTPTAEADVIVVGAGPAGSTIAHDLAGAGVDVLLLEKTRFPRDKVCGDGLTPRGVRQLLRIGVDTTGPGWIRNRGLRVLGGGMRIEMPWPDLATFPDHGLVRHRLDLDELLSRHATKAGAHLREQTTVTGPVTDPRTDRVVGVIGHGPEREPLEFRAPVVVAADGVSARLPTAMGWARRADRPIGVAVRGYFRSTRHLDDHLESWLELRDGPAGTGGLLPGYGWIFGMGDGTSNVGLGILNTTESFGRLDYRAMLNRWVASFPPEWGMSAENAAVGPVRGAALPMGFNRTPLYDRGLLLLGDACGAVNPFNGEGIAYAMESAEVAAEAIVQALGRRDAAGREHALRSYPAAMRAGYGGYYALGRRFVRLIGHPRVMTLATRHGLPHPMLMRFLLRLLANLTDPDDGDATDRVINALVRLAPAR
jgi:geranylgeranyl reductase family protein